MPTQPQTVTIAQARASTASGLLVLDSGANIVAALPNSALTARIASFTLSGPAALTAAQMTLLIPIASKLHAAAGALQLTGANMFSVAQLTPFEALPGFAVASGGSITLSDTATQIVGALLSHLSWFAQVTTVSIQLDGSSMGAYPATLLENMILHGKTVVFVPTAGHTTLNISAAAHDLATNATSLNALATHQALTISVNNDGSAISAADAASLLTLQGFSPSAHTLTIADTGANISPRIATLLGTGYSQIMVTSGTLSGTASQLLDPSIQYAAGTHAQLSASTTVNVAVATNLAALPSFSHAAGAVLTVADTAANLTATSSAWLAVASAVSLTANATVSAAGAMQLASIAAGVGGALSLGGHSLTISDTLSALAALPNPAASLATAIALAANATASTAQLAAFANLPNATLGGHTITLVDSATNVLGLAPAALALASGVSLSADAVVSAANANNLTALPNFSTSGHALTVNDTAAGLLALTPASLALVTSTLLSADASLTAQQAQTIFNEPGFSTAGHQLSVIDTATNLLSLTHGLQVAATALTLSGNQTISAAAATQLAALGIKFSEAGHTVTIQDTATNLATLSGAGLALASNEVLGTSATVSAATAASLAALPNLSLASGATLSVQDSVANLITLGQGASAFVGSETLPSGSVVTITAAQATALAALPHFSTAGATITVADTIANLNTAGSATLASIGSSIDIVDTASNLASNAATSLVQNAASVTLSANAQITAASATQIASIPHFTTGSYQLTVTDTVANLITLGQGASAFISSETLPSGSVVTITAAQATALAALPHFSTAGATITVADTIANLNTAGSATLTSIGSSINIVDTASNLAANAATSLVQNAASVTLSANAQITAASAAQIASIPHFVLGSYHLTVADTAANLITLGQGGSAFISSESLLSGSVVTITAAQATALAALPHFSTSGATITVADTIANLNTAGPATLASIGSSIDIVDTASNLASNAATSLVQNAASVTLSGNAQITAASATQIASIPHFTSGGYQLTVADTAANLTATSSAWLAVASAVSLTANATVSAAGAMQLASIAAGVGGALSLGGHSLTISDTLSALAALPNPAASLATAIALAANATASTAQLAAFANLPNATLGGHTITLVDSATNVLGLAPAALALASGVSLSADAVVSAANANNLTALPNFSTSGHALTVNDTAAGLLALTPASLALVTSTLLSADASLTAQQAQTIFNEPGFSTAGHQLSVIDTATNLLSLTHGLQVAATALTLSGNQTISAAAATQLAALGIKFSEAGHTVTIQDTATNLATLSGAGLALASNEVLGTSATVSAATAASLAALPNLSLASGATLSVQDSVANLITLGQGASAFVGSETLPSGSVVTITAAQATALAALPHFSTAGATITIADTIANLNTAGSATLASIGSSIDIVDTASNLASNAATSLVQNAASVTLSANAQITAASATQIASIPHFTTGSYQLTVTDTAAHVASHAAAIIGVATQTLVTDSGPINVAAADQLAIVASAGTLSFQGGDQLLVQDSFAALISAGNATGFALAARIGVIDTPANLVAASAHNWDGLNPSYTLSQGGTISAATASSLAGLGSHFSVGGYSLSVADTAAATVAAASALNSLHISASVTDTAVNLGSQASGLVNLGAAISQIHVSNVTPVTASVAAGLSTLSSLMTGVSLQVSDTAANVDTSLAGLTTLGAHVAITVSDSAANVAPYVSDLATLGNNVTIALNDTAPVLAALVTSLAPIAADFVTGTLLNVTDTGANIAAHASGLSAMSSDIGLITLSGGTTLSASNAAAFASLDAHLPAGVMLTATGTAASIAANLPALTSLNTDHRLAAVVVSATSVADATTNVAALNALATQVTISDTAAHVDAGLAALAQVSGLQTIALMDAGTPSLSMSLATLATNAPILAKITTPYHITISDTAADISADIALGGASVIAAHLTQINQISASDSQPIVLTQVQLLAAGVDDGPGSAMAKFSGMLDVNGVDVGHLAQITGLGHSPTAISVVDTGSQIAADLALGNASVLVSALPTLTSITAVDGQAVSLTAAQAMVAGIDDTAHSAIASLHGADLVITSATVADLPGLSGLQVQPASISVSDTAADISADLASGGSALIATLSTIHTIAVSDGQTITLTEQQVLAPHVDDGTGSVLAETTGGNLAVTGVAASDIAEMLDLGVAPISLSITDSAAHVVSNLATEISDINDISAINITGAPLTLTAGEALSAHVDDGAGSLIELVAGHVFNVSGASVAQFSALQSLPRGPASISVTDSSTNIVNDLVSASPILPNAGGQLGTITVTHGTLTLTDAQADAILTNPSLDNVLGHLAPSTVVSVSGVPVSDVANIAGSGWPHVTLAVTDTAADITADLSGSSTLLANAASIGTVTLDANATVNATALANLANLPQFSTGGFALTLQDGIGAIQGLAAAPLALAHQINVVDSAANLGPNLNALQSQFAGHLHIRLTDTSPLLVINSAAYVADRATIDAVTNSAAFTVTGSADLISPLAATLGADSAVGAVNVSDYAANVIADLGALQAAGTKLYVYLYDSNITANLVSPLLGISNLTSPAIPVIDTGSQIAAVVETGNSAAISYLNTNGVSLADSSPVSAADVAALESLTGFSKAGNNLVVWDTAQHLTGSSYAAALSSGLIDSVHLKTSAGTVTVTAAMAATLFGIPGFTTDNPSGTSNALIVSDTAAHIEANLAALTANTSHISSVVVSNSATITDSVLTDLQSLGATAASGVNLTVRDTGSVIAANAAAQSSGHSISPSAWTLSSNATLSESAATILGGLPTFSPGLYTITLSLSSDTSISIADANKLGNLAGALNLGGYHLIVSGTAAQLAVLSSAALSVVTPALADTLANIVALPQASLLLQGTVEVTGNDTLSAAAVSTLFSLIRSGGGAGIAPGALSFDNAHTVNDSIASLRSLTNGTGWTANPALHTSFHLSAQDTIANLTNAANTAFLSGLSTSTLQGNVTISASAASSLAALSNTIHFSRGAFHITVQDSAAHLLSTSNSGGVGFADTVVLAGPDQVDASDAEALLAITHFNLNTSLTIIDSSSNLLDGALSGDITGSGFGAHIQVQLAGPETLDAQTAESLVTIPGFSDTHNLTIADDPSYLLNNANISAEQMAIQVTLAGDETVSANTVLRLSQVPHFTPGTSELVLASNDFADAATLKAIADMGSAFNHNGHSLTMTADALNLTPMEYAALQSDGVVQNGHALGIQPTGVTLSDSANLLSVSGSGVAGGTVRIYAADGSLLSSNMQVNAGFTVSAADTGPGHNFSVTEIVNGSANEGAPLLVLDAATLESTVAASGGSFASSGAIQVDAGKFVNLYLAGSVPALSHAALVYDPSAHTLALDVPGQSPVTLVTLGGSTHPATLDVSEILFKTHG